MPTTSQRHRYAKAVTGALGEQRGYNVHFEAGTDVVWWRVRSGRLEYVFLEIALSTRNVIRNQQRNDAQRLLGPRKDGIVVPSEKLAGAVRRKLRRYLPEERARRIAVILLCRLEQCLSFKPAPELRNTT